MSAVLHRRLRQEGTCLRRTKGHRDGGCEICHCIAQAKARYRPRVNPSLLALS